MGVKNCCRCSDKLKRQWALQAIVSYYFPKGSCWGHSAIPKLAKAAGVLEDVARDFLQKQAVWQVFLPPSRCIPRPHSDITVPNEVHQADLLFLPHDKVGRSTYKYAVTVVDMASHYKGTELLT